MLHKHTRSQQPRQPAATPPRRAGGFTLLELLMLMAVLGIILAIAVPMYSKSQRMQQLRTVAQGLEGALTALRNLALTGREVVDRSGGTEQRLLPDGYCLAIQRDTADVTVLSPFWYREGGGDEQYTPPGSANPVADTVGSLGPDPITAPNLQSEFRNIRISDVKLRRITAGVETVTSALLPPPGAAAHIAPALCFVPPQAQTQLVETRNPAPGGSTTGAPLTPAILVYELGSAALDGVLRVEVDSATGKITTTDALSAPL